VSDDIERRIAPGAAPLRAAGGTGSASGRRLVGYAALFNSRSADLGGMTEILEPGCFTKALKISDVRALMNHDANLLLGRTKAGTLRLREDATGLLAEIDVPATPFGDSVLESVRRGDLTQMSFAFRVAPNGDRYSTDPDGRTLRRITEVAELYDVSPVVYAAYPATSLSLRARARVNKPAPAAAQRRRLDVALQDNARALAAIEAREVARYEAAARAERRVRHCRIMAKLVDNPAMWRAVERAAVHEAGHAALFWADGANVDAVGLVLEDRPALSVGGFARCVDPDLRSAGAILGGIAAERLAGLTLGEPPDRGDVRKARMELPLDGRSHNDVEREIGRAQDRLQKLWPSVLELARQIRRNVEVDGPDAERIIARAVTNTRNARTLT
jgi:uncharacterized protein